jgi:hypothetical protein
VGVSVPRTVLIDPDDDRASCPACGVRALAVDPRRDGLTRCRKCGHALTHDEWPRARTAEGEVALYEGHLTIREDEL